MELVSPSPITVPESSNTYNVCEAQQYDGTDDGS